MTDAVKANVVDFYCSDIISVIIPSMKNKYIIREERGYKVRDKNGNKVKLQRCYLMYHLREVSKMFCEQHPETKISRSTFCNHMPDHVMLRS